MYSIEEYNNQVIKLAKSLTIKLLDVALAINKGLTKQYDNIEISSDMKTWKYFQNISGQRHYLNPEEPDETKKVSTNADVLITIIELGQKQLLTKELLEKHPYTRNELLKQEDFYDNLLNTYPNEVLYIHGCMYPCNIEKAIEAKEGTILAYNENFIETNEKYLIPELQTSVQNFLSRWHIKEYTIIEELYLSSMLANLYAMLPLKINNLRLEKIFTNEVHSFHLEHFFRSHLNIWDELQVVSNETKYWLYKNLPYIIKHLGKTSTFQILLNKILTPNDVGVGIYNLNISNTALNKNSATNKPSYSKGELSLYSEPLNNYYINSGYKDLNSILSKELSDKLEISSEQDGFIIDRAIEKIKDSQKDNQRTKLIEISTYEYYKKYGVDLFKIIIDYWAYGIKTNTLQFNVEYVDPNTNQPILISTEQGLLLLIKFILASFNSLDLKLSEIYYDLVFYPDNSCIDQVSSAIFKDGYTPMFFKELKENYPTLGKIITSNLEMNDMLTSVINYSSYLWIIDSNAENSIVSANMKTLINLITDKGSLILSTQNETIDQILDREQCNIELKDGYNINSSIRQLIQTFTGLEINEYNIIKNISDSYKTLVQKLTAYTTQVITQDTGEDTIYLYYNNTNIFRSQYGVINILGAEFRSLDETYAKLKVISNNQVDTMTTFIENNIGIRTAELRNAKLFKGSVELYGNKPLVWIAPQFQVEVIDENEYPYDIEVGIINIKTGAAKFLEENYPKISVKSKIIEYPFTKNNIGLLTMEMDKNKVIEGTVEVYDNKDNVWLSPQFQVESVKDTEYPYDIEDNDIVNNDTDEN